MKFDFFIPEKNTVIEYDGIQHFKAIEFFGGENGFRLTKLRDEIKDKWCLLNDVNLIRIDYLKSKDEIISILKEL